MKFGARAWTGTGKGARSGEDAGNNSARSPQLLYFVAIYIFLLLL